MEKTYMCLSVHVSTIQTGQERTSQVGNTTKHIGTVLETITEIMYHFAKASQ